jgi:DNA invertase Pin-like site-specific DNA recombinase
MEEVAGYIRVSTAKQAEEDSHVRQKETVREWAEESIDGEYEITWFEDIAESGQNLSRDEYDEMMDKAHRFDMVVVRELSRFGRSLRKVLEDIEILDENDCSFVSVKDEHIDTSSAQGKLLFHIIASFNQFWADMARERQLEQIQRRREEGKPIGREKKLSDEQIQYLYDQKESENHSHTTLAAIAEAKGWCDSITRQTISKYMSAVEDGEIDA